MVKLKYGSTQIEIEIPKESIIIKDKVMLPLSNPEEEIRKALKNPIGAPPLSQIVKPNESVAILVSDRTRKTGAEVFLPILIDELNKAEVPDEKIFIVFAMGTHSFHTKEQQEAIVGKNIASRLKMFDHDCRDQSNLKHLGKTSRNTEAYINNRVLEADRIILTGSITYHYFAGFGGGRKSILPGIAGFESIQTNHRLCMSSPKAITGNLEGNPVSEDMEEIAKMVKPDFILNTVLNADRKIAAIFAGDLIAAHRAGCKFVDDCAKVFVKEKADLVIASSGGGTKDVNFVQAHKGIENASYALKEGGTMIFFGECSESFPSDVYEKYIKLGSAHKIEEELLNNFTIPGHSVFSAFQKAEKFKIIWITKLDKQIVKQMKMIPADNFSEAWEIAKKLLPKNYSSYIIPEAYTTFPNVVK